MEEAGLDLALDGILRFEYRVTKPKGKGDTGFVRFRCIFAGHQIDESKPLKTIPDSETYGAEWLTIDELKGIGMQDPSVLEKIKNIPRIQTILKKGGKKKGEFLRGREPIKMFEWYNKGTKVFPLALYHGINGQDIDNYKVKVNTSIAINIISKHLKSDTYLVISRTVDVLMNFKGFAGDLLNSIYKKKKLKYDGICGIYHEPPKKKFFPGHMALSFYFESKSTKVSKEFNDVKWVTAKEILANEEDYSKAVCLAVKNCEDGVIAPSKFLVREGCKQYTVL